MEATSVGVGVGGEAQQLLYGGRGVNSVDYKRTVEWDLNRWNWDGDLFIATPIRPDRAPSNPTAAKGAAASGSNNLSSCSEDLSLAIWQDKESDLNERKRRIVQVRDDTSGGEAATLALNLSGNGNGNGYPILSRPPSNWEGTNGKKPKIGGANSNRAVCQVEDCGADLSKAKDYHRRHKVCEVHSKATRAVVGNVLQRFCQQCSRFHALQEFDEGKRSCRRRLAGHNKRRRKTQPDSAANSNSANDNQASAYLLMSLLKILSSVHSTRASGTNDEDLLSHLLKILGSQSGDKNIGGLLQESQTLVNNGTSHENSIDISTLHANGHQVPPRPKQHNSSAVGTMQRVSNVHDRIVEDLHTTSSKRPGTILPSPGSSLAYGEVVDDSAARSKLNSFDLNDAYIDSDDGVEDVEQLPVPADLRNGSLGCPLWVQQDSQLSSPPQTSGNSDSASAQSPSSSSGEAQNRTDRIVFKLFGREPSDFPFVLRAQILDWLAHSPTDIESYIRPGCVILTLYLRLPESKWEELSFDLSSSLSKLLDVSDDDNFWRTGWIYTRVQNRISFAYNGRTVVDTSLSFRRNEYSSIVSVKPIAIPMSERAQFVVKGINLTRPSTSLLCALEGKYLALEANSELDEHVDGSTEHEKLQSLKFSCSLPAMSGRGFIEVEDHGLSSSFFPFIVAEKDICSEISMLEREIELTERDYVLGETSKTEARDQALDFVHEMGWLLHRNNSKSRLSHLDPNSNLFPFSRYKWLMEFSIDHDWRAVVKKLLDILLDGKIGGEDYPFLKYALSELGLLHRAVRRNSRSLVEFLLNYTPQKVAEELSLEYKSLVGSDDGSFLFRPDFEGPGGLTPLHVAAGTDGSEDVLDALTNDPGEVAIKAWKNTRDSTGFTPEDYARLRGHYSYIHLVQKKINKRATSGHHVVVDIPSTTDLKNTNINQKQDEAAAATTFEIAAGSQSRASVKGRPCGLCDQKVAYRYGSRNQTLLYRPAMLSMVAIAAVCVCVALLFKSSPEVLYIFQPFRWEMLDYGSN